MLTLTAQLLTCLEHRVHQGVGSICSQREAEPAQPSASELQQSMQQSCALVAEAADTPAAGQARQQTILLDPLHASSNMAQNTGQSRTRDRPIP